MNSFCLASVLGPIHFRCDVILAVGLKWHKLVMIGLNPKKNKRFLLTLCWYGTNSGDSLEIKVV